MARQTSLGTAPDAPVTPDVQLAPRVLIAVADLERRTKLAEAIRQQGFLVSSTTESDAALTLAASFSPEVIVVDLRLWAPDGGTVFRALRGNADAYVIALAPTDASERRVNALRAGADDVVSDATSPLEVAARCVALLRRPRRSRRGEPAAGVVRVGPITVDLGRRELMIGGQDVGATKVEFALFELLCLHPTKTLTREQLLDHASGHRSNADVHVVNVHMSNLRGKLQRLAPGLRVIESVRGVGFRLAATPDPNE